MKLTFRSTKDGDMPEHNTDIYYYVENNPFINCSLLPRQSKVTYEWYSSCGEVMEYYDPIEDNDFKVGDSRPSKHFQNSETDSHKTVTLTIFLHDQSVAGNPFSEDFPHLTWQYCYVQDTEVGSNALGKGKYFPCEFVNTVLNNGAAKVLDYEQRLIESFKDDENFYHIVFICEYKGDLYKIKAAQDGFFKNNEWLCEGVYQPIDIFQYESTKYSELEKHTSLKEDLIRHFSEKGEEIPEELLKVLGGDKL